MKEKRRKEQKRMKEIEGEIEGNFKEGDKF